MALPLMTAAVALLVASCNRRTPTTTNDTSPAPPTTTGTSGSVAQPAPPAEGETSTASTNTPSDNPQRDPDAIKALEKMGDYLRTLKAFQVRVETNRDDVLDDGQAVEFDGVADVIVERPNRLRADVMSDRQQRQYFYDGKSLTVWARRVNYFATVPAPATIHELIDTLSSKYDIELPVADLFYWSDPKSASEIMVATNVGPSQVGGVTCEHYAFRQEGADWEAWIQRGDYPLPRKVVIRTLTDEARPRFASMLTWNLAPSFNDSSFTFVPPPDAKKIALIAVNGSEPERSSGH